MDESRRKKERAVRRDLAEAQSFALVQDSRERAAGASRPTNNRHELGREERGQDCPGASGRTEKAELLMRRSAKRRWSSIYGCNAMQ